MNGDISNVILNPNNLYKGNCLELMSGIEDGSVDLILSDLPYGVLNKSNPSAKWDSVLPFDELWSHYERIIKPNGAIVLFSQGLFTDRLCLSNEKMFRYRLVWKKGDGVTGFLNANRMPMRNHEDICVFYKKLPTYNPQMENDGRKHHKGGNSGSSNCYGKFTSVKKSYDYGTFPRSVINIPKVYNTKHHPTEKPLGLLGYLIRTYTNEGDLVLDNTMGSGSTCVAVIREGRRYIGIEKEEKYYDIACKRVESALRDRDMDMFKDNKDIYGNNTQQRILQQV